MADQNNMEQDSQKFTFFNFEVTQPQRVIILIFTLTGLFLLPLLLGGEIIYNLLNNLFKTLPYFLSHPEYYAEFYLFNNFAPNIIRIIIFGLFFYLSLTTIRKLIRGVEDIKSQKDKIIFKDRTVKWFGFKLDHGQAIFIFSLSVMGIPFIILALICINSPFFTMFYEELCYIPTSENSATCHQIILSNTPLILNGLFLVLCFYSIFKTRRGKQNEPNQLKTANTISMVIFIISLIIFLVYLMRFLSHLFLFTDLAYILGITPDPTNPFQFNDLVNVVIILIGSLSMLVFTYFIKKKSYNQEKKKNNTRWLHIELTKNKFLMLLSGTIMYLALLSFTFISQFFMFGALLFRIEILGFYLIALFPISYSVFKVYNRELFRKVLSNYDDTDNFRTKWITFKLNRLQSVIVCSVSSAAIPYYIFYMLTIRTNILFTEITEIDPLYFVQLILMLVVLSSLLIFTLYTIKCTYRGVKSR